MEEKTTATPSVRQSLLDLAPGDSLTFPLERIERLRSVCSTIGLARNRSYSVRSDRVARTATVIRNY